MTPSGIEPATFRFVPQHLNHYATAVPIKIIITIISKVSHYYLVSLLLLKGYETQTFEKWKWISHYLPPK